MPAVVSALGWARCWLALALLLLPVAIALFFRDPERDVRRPIRHVVLAPADGTVMHAGPARPDEAPPGDVAAGHDLLSLLDVHINRTPVAGRVTASTTCRARSCRRIAHDAHQQRALGDLDRLTMACTVVVRQVVGVLARRVVCRVNAGDALAAGDRIGLMKFGSRMDVFVPPRPRVLVARGQTRCAAGETVIARLPARPS